MDYRRIHDAIIDRARNRQISSYTESHHVIPRCMDGSNYASNLVKLTPEEHYVVHQLLVKIYPTNIKLAYAAMKMCHGRPTNKLYGWLRRRYANAVAQVQQGKGNSQYGTAWVTNGSINKKHRMGHELEPGWRRGRSYPPKFDKVELCNECELAAHAYEWFTRFKASQCKSMREFVRNSEYPYSHVNFRAMLQKYVKEFNPKHGKKYVPG